MVFFSFFSAQLCLFWMHSCDPTVVLAGSVLGPRGALRGMEGSLSPSQSYSRQPLDSDDMG